MICMPWHLHKYCLFILVDLSLDEAMNSCLLQDSLSLSDVDVI